MSHTKDEREDGVFCEDIIESPPLVDDGGAGGGVLKKGPWTSYEDTILIDYVQKHGEGNWNAIQKHCGLFRCGKSCRLRWANHLRPNLKKGAFTQEEEQLIIELHAKMGNKWARMAAHLPGRTDNEIKNYWNTRIKRHQRAGLPLYPPQVDLQAQQASHCSSAINGGDKGPHDILQNNSYKIPDIVFNSLKANQCVSPYVPGIPDMSARSMLTKGSGSPQCSSFMAPLNHRHKRLRESTIFFPGYNDAVKNECPLFQQFQDDMSNNSARSFSIGSDGSHALSNGDFYASKPTSKAVKLKLPSLQSPVIELGNWGTLSCPPPLLENVDAFIQSQPPTSGFESDSLSPYNSGLLDALLLESKTLTRAAKHASDKSLNSSNPSDIAESSYLNIRETEWKNHGESRSPICHSTTSHFGGSINASDNSSLGEQPLAETFPESDVKSKPVDHVLTSEIQKKAPIWMDGDRPDTLLGQYWLGQGSGYDKDQTIMTDATATLLGDNSSNEYKNLGATSISSQAWGFGSCAWNDMPTLCQMSELPSDLLPQL